MSLVSGDIGTFLQITDPHIDILYMVGSPANCEYGWTGLGCCRSTSIPIQPYRNAGKYGDVNCDVSSAFVDETFKYIAKRFPDLDFIFWTGDNPDHHDFTQTYRHNMDEIELVAKLIKDNFKNIPVFPVLGNHDTWPVDQLSLNFAKTKLSVDMTSLFTDNGWLNNQALFSFSQNGYYSIMMNPKLLLIGLNSLYYENNNLFIKGVDDPANQLKWLESQLKNSMINNIKVWIISHTPPTTRNTFSEKYYKIVLRYSSIITGQFFGHTHSNRFLIFYNELLNKPVNHAYISASILPQNQDASFRIYYYNRTDMSIVNYEEYYSNIDEANRSGKVVYNYGYDPLSLYDMKSVESSDWFDLYNRLNVNNTLLMSYVKNYHPNSNKTCDIACQFELVNEIVYF